jgi:5-methylcytosine-specific restriction endonuclease McrA
MLAAWLAESAAKNRRSFVASLGAGVVERHLVDVGDLVAAFTAREDIADATDDMCPTEAKRALDAAGIAAADDHDEMIVQPTVERRRRWRYALGGLAAKLDAKIAGHHARAVAYDVRSTLIAIEWGQILQSHLGECAYCGVADDQLTLDHITPMCRGGTNTADNVVACCGQCNASKNAHHVYDWLQRRDLDAVAAFRRIDAARARRLRNNRRQSSAVVGEKTPTRALV